MKGKNLEKKVYLECEVERGFFDSERSVKIVDVNGEKYQALVDKDDVKTKKEPQGEEVVRGFVKVDVAAKCKEGYLVDLPQETFTSGPRIAVPAERLMVEK